MCTEKASNNTDATKTQFTTRDLGDKTNEIAKINTITQFTTRSTDYYSIDYPLDWSVVIKPDPLSDVYIGDPEGNLGFTILFFHTEDSLSEINKEGNSNMTNAGAKLTYNNQKNINGQECFKSIFEFSVNYKTFKHISYTFKKNNTLFNVKFGGKKTIIDKNSALIENIIQSFKINGYTTEKNSQKK